MAIDGGVIFQSGGAQRATHAIPRGESAVQPEESSLVVAFRSRVREVVFPDELLVCGALV